MHLIMNSKFIVGLIVVIVVVVGGVVLWSGKSSAPASEDMNNATGTVGQVQSGSSTVESASPAVKEFVVEAGNFKFSVKEMKVKKGDTVRVVFKNTEGFHDWVLDEFAGAKTKQLQAGKEETIEFVVDKTGTFEYYCSVGQHRANGMVGKLIVE